MSDSQSDSKDDSGQPIATGDVTADLSSSDPAGRVPDRKVRVLCPYCGRGTLLGARCEQCKGLLDPLSRQATQNSMGPWFLHDPQNPFRPGCSYEVIRDMVRRGRITDKTVLRGPTTRQYWMLASRTPSVANLLGKCHNCQKAVAESEIACHGCGADFSPELDRQNLGLGPVHLLPGQASPEEVALSAQRAAHPPAAAGNHHHAAATRPAASENLAETGEYRALLNRVERLDRELGTARLLLTIASLSVIVLAGAVLWFSGVFRSTPSPGGAWTTPPAPTASTPAGTFNTPSHRTPEDEPADTSMPGDPPPEQPAAEQAVPAQPAVDEPPPRGPGTASVPPADSAAPSVPPETEPSTPATVDRRASEWALLRGLP